MISIVIPTYNRKNELLLLLNKLEEQTDKRFEVIIIDDCSSEKYHIIDDTYTFKVYFYRNKENKGPSESRNIGSKRASYDWICFLDDDDYYTNDKIEVLINKINSHRNIDLFYHKAKINLINENRYYITNISYPKKNRDMQIFESNFIGGAPVIAIKKDVFINIGGFDNQLKAIEDYDFSIRCVLNKLNMKMIDKVLIVCNLYTERSSVSKNILNTQKALSIIEDKYELDKFQRQAYSINKKMIMSYAYNMNLSRKCSFYYLLSYLKTFKFKYLAAFILSFLNPTFILYFRSKKHEKNIKTNILDI